MIPLVLCVDDDAITLMLCKMMMTKSLFCEDSVRATNGKEALLYFEKQSLLSQEEQKIPALVMLDLNMPVLDGWEFLEMFNANYKQFHQYTKVVILSSSVNPEDKKKAKDYPLIIDFVAKPLSIDGLEKLKLLDDLKKFF